VIIIALALSLAATPVAARDTAARLHVFTRELNSAARDLRVARPTVRAISLAERPAGTSPNVAAFVTPGRPWVVTVIWHQLMSASDARLRCWARHEMTHVKLKHEYSKNAREAAWHHDQVALFMEARWRQESTCMMN
jgi:predicted Zn-dependent protease